MAPKVNLIFNDQYKNAIKYILLSQKKHKFDMPHFFDISSTFQNNFKIYNIITLLIDRSKAINFVTSLCSLLRVGFRPYFIMPELLSDVSIRMYKWFYYPKNKKLLRIFITPCFQGFSIFLKNKKNLLCIL